ncbi:hypothetical protein [Catenulispora rubra]|uniref:hypothetical protein n=1 Tax=Catenulispora rubra TaxID=280293 RepID=UPI00189255BF|nr:hypothetical protein [Catenulispora rubra]
MRTTGNSPRILGSRRPGRRAAEELLDHAGGPGAAGAVPGAAGAANVGDVAKAANVAGTAGIAGIAGTAAGSPPAGSGHETRPDLEALARLLDAAAGPALTAELSGEDAARAVFSAHHSASATPSKERRVFSKALLAKTVTVKIVVAVCGVSVVGVSAAAATNSLPSGIQSKAHSLGFPAPKDTKDTKDNRVGGTDLITTPVGADGKGPDVPTPTGAPTKAAPPRTDQAVLDAAGAKLLGDDSFRLCKAAEDGDRDDQGHDLTAAELQKLAKAANVPAADIAKLQSALDAERSEAQKRMQDFCNRLAQAEKDVHDGHAPTFPIPTPHPGDGWPTTWPTTWPTHLPSGLPTGLPTHLPSGLPTHLPTGLPTHLPSGAPTWPTGWPIDGGPQNPVDPIHPGAPTATGSIGGSQH